MSRYLNLLAIVFFCSLPCVAQETYVHEGTGLKFPPRIGSLERGEVTDLGEGRESIPYSSPSPNQISVTIELYPRKRAFKEELETLEENLKARWEHYKRLEKKKVKTGKRPGLRRRYRLQDKRKTHFSETRLYAIGDTTFKLHLTGDFRARKSIERAGVRLVSNIIR